MHRPLRVLALALALAATPACASLPFGEMRIENPVAAARTLDQRAYALLQTYAAGLEEAADLARDPSTPADVRRALARAEARAAPAIEALYAAFSLYRAGAGPEAEAGLRSALADAEPTVGDLQSILRSRR